jgi:uncharacterized protein
MSSKDKYPFGTFGPEHLEKVRAGIECFNAKEYWECHEALEHVWLEDLNDPARNVYWAIIQVAAALYHYENNNLIGVLGLHKKSKQKFDRCRDQAIETDLVLKYLEWNKLRSLVFSIGEDAKLEDFKQLYDFKFEVYQ